MHVIESLDFHARFRPNELALIRPAGGLTFRQLRLCVLGAAKRLQDAQIDRDRPVGIYVADPLLHLVLVLALMHQAIPSFSGHPNYDAPPADAAIGSYLFDQRKTFMEGAAVLPVDSSWAAPLAPGAPQPERRAFASPQSLVRIVASSGTTGVPKAVGLESQLIAGTIENPVKIGAVGEGPSIIAIGLASGVGFRTYLAQLQRGIAQVLLGGQLDIMTAINMYGVRVLTVSPIQLQKLVEGVERNAVRLPSLKCIHVGGSTTPPVTALRARARLCPAVTGAYGATEVGMIAEAPPEILERVPGCVGFVHPWNRVEIVDEEDRPLPPGTDGHVRIRTPTMVKGYLGDPPDNRTAFRDGWFYPGDLGSMTAEGLLTISGRAAEVINAGGVKVSPTLIVNALYGIFGIVEAAAFGVDYPDRPTEIWAAVVSSNSVDERAIIETCRRSLGDRGPHRVVQVDAIPRNAMGKVVTAELRRQVARR